MASLLRANKMDSSTGNQNEGMSMSKVDFFVWKQRWQPSKRKNNQPVMLKLKQKCQQASKICMSKVDCCCVWKQRWQSTCDGKNENKAESKTWRCWRLFFNKGGNHRKGKTINLWHGKQKKLTDIQKRHVDVEGWLFFFLKTKAYWSVIEWIVVALWQG